MNGPKHRTDDQLTAEEIECLELLAEEAIEVALACSKMKRFGRNAIDRNGIEHDNVRELSREIGDLNHLATLACQYGLATTGAIAEGIRRKEVKLVAYARHIGKRSNTT